MGNHESYQPSITTEADDLNFENNQFREIYPVKLASGENLRLPLVPLPRKEGQREMAIALLMSTELDFEVEKFLADQLTEQVTRLNPDVIVGIPSLGLGLARQVAQNLGHKNFVPLSQTKKFWFSEELSIETDSVTSGAGKKLYLDPAIINRVNGRKVVIIDDVACTGGTLGPAVRLIRQASGEIVGIGLVLTEGYQWKEVLEKIGFPPEKVVSVGHIPLFEKNQQGLWVPILETV